MGVHGQAGHQGETQLSSVPAGQARKWHLTYEDTLSTLVEHGFYNVI